MYDLCASILPLTLYKQHVHHNKNHDGFHFGNFFLNEENACCFQVFSAFVLIAHHNIF